LPEFDAGKKIGKSLKKPKFQDISRQWLSGRGIWLLALKKD
jgi:hypothetical protein